jgi:hypothetical protein
MQSYFVLCLDVTCENKISGGFLLPVEDFTVRSTSGADDTRHLRTNVILQVGESSKKSWNCQIAQCLVFCHPTWPVNMMFSSLTALRALLLLRPVSLTSPQHVLNSDDTGPFTSKFGELVHETLELFHVPGVSIAVVDGD